MVSWPVAELMVRNARVCTLDRAVPWAGAVGSAGVALTGLARMPTPTISWAAARR